MEYKDLIFRIDGNVAIITLNRPDHRNAFSADMLDSWFAALKTSEADPNIHVIIITGEGKSFCAGGDIKNFMSQHLSPWKMKRFLQEKIHRIACIVEELDKPLIAAINGPAFGAGMDMALMCDVRIASDRAQFCESYIKLGMIPGDGGAYFLPRLVGTAKALEWLLTGKIIDINEAFRFGLVNLVTPHETLMKETLNVANKMANYSPLSIRLTKKAVYSSLHSNLRHHLDYISSQVGLLCDTDYFKKAVEEYTRNGYFKE